MSSSYVANSAWVITDNNWFYELELPTWAYLEAYLKAEPLFAEILRFEQDEQSFLLMCASYQELGHYSVEELSNILEAYQQLQEDFFEETQLDLAVDYHNSEEYGSCYDEADGVFFTVERVQSYTLAGGAVKDKLDHACWVSQTRNFK